MVKHLLFILIAVAPLSFKAQNNDFGIWSSLSLEKNLKKGFETKLNLESRTKHNSKYLYKTFAELSVDKKINSNLKLSVLYRYSNHYRFSEYTNLSHRASLDLRYKIKPIDVLRISYRLRLQNEQDHSFFNTSCGENAFINRHKFSIKYDYKTFLSPTFSTDFFLNKNLSLFKYRLTIKNPIKLSKHHEIALLYSYQKEEIINEFIVKVGYVYKM